MPERKDWKKNTVDGKMIVYMVIGLGTVLVSSLGFGKPYSPAVISSVGFLVNGLVGWFYPGLYDWLDKSCLVLVVFTLFFELFWKWWRLGHVYRDDF